MRDLGSKRLRAPNLESAARDLSRRGTAAAPASERNRNCISSIVTRLAFIKVLPGGTCAYDAGASRSSGRSRRCSGGSHAPPPHVPLGLIPVPRSVSLATHYFFSWLTRFKDTRQATVAARRLAVLLGVGVPEGARPVEDEGSRRGVRVHAKVSQPLQLEPVEKERGRRFCWVMICIIIIGIEDS